jgi:membrane-associated HD superfamily phosphohydrolase
MDDSFMTRILLGLGISGIIGVGIGLGFLTQNKDNGAEIQKNLGIIAGVTGILILLFGVVSYIYFSSNINYMAPFVLIMTFVNLFMSVFAVSAASLQVVNS